MRQRVQLRLHHHRSGLGRDNGARISVSSGPMLSCSVMINVLEFRSHPAYVGG